MRVIAGKYKSRKLDMPNKEDTRPTTDKTKEAIFSMLEGRVENSIGIDLFAGSGSLGIEALSRGAMKFYFVENHSGAIKTLASNISKLEIRNCEIMRQDFRDFLRSKKGAKFSLIFIDPPYDKKEYYDQALELISKNHLLSIEGTIVLEKSANIHVEIPHNLAIYNKKKYGNTKVLFISAI